MYKKLLLFSMITINSDIYTNNLDDALMDMMAHYTGLITQHNGKKAGVEEYDLAKVALSAIKSMAQLSICTNTPIIHEMYPTLSPKQQKDIYRDCSTLSHNLRVLKKLLPHPQLAEDTANLIDHNFANIHQK